MLTNTVNIIFFMSAESIVIKCLNQIMRTEGQIATSLMLQNANRMRADLLHIIPLCLKGKQMNTISIICEKKGKNQMGRKYGNRKERNTDTRHGGNISF